MSDITSPEIEQELQELRARLEKATAQIARLMDRPDPERLIAWIKDDSRRPAMEVFTCGPERQIAYYIEMMLARRRMG